MQNVSAGEKVRGWENENGRPESGDWRPETGGRRRYGEGHLSWGRQTPGVSEGLTAGGKEESTDSGEECFGGRGREKVGDRRRKTGDGSRKTGDRSGKTGGRRRYGKRHLRWGRQTLRLAKG